MIKVYSADMCGYCQQAKALLDSVGIEYTEIDIYQDSEAMDVMREMKFTSVPQISIDDVWIGGFDELTEMHDAGALDSIIKG
jgi:glutaredoxin 3